jgi:hypothetical protein
VIQSKLDAIGRVLLELGEAERRAAQAALADAIRHDEDV